MRIGQGCYIYNKINEFGTEPWLIEIGNHVSVTSGVVLLTHDGAHELFRKQYRNMNVFGNKFGTIRIHDNCFIGYRAILLPSVEIGPNSIVGAGSVVTKSVPPNTVVAGNPAQKICLLDDYINRYQNKMVQLAAKDRIELRHELTMKLWGEVR